MRRTTIGSRWNTPGRRYTGGWRQNPWINAVYIALQARSETDGSSCVSIDADAVADRRHGGEPDTSQHNDSNRDRQQRAAVRTWENEGGSLGAQPGMSR